MRFLQIIHLLLRLLLGLGSTALVLGYLLIQLLLSGLLVVIGFAAGFLDLVYLVLQELAFVIAVGYNFLQLVLCVLIHLSLLLS